MIHSFNLNLDIAGKIKKILPELIKLIEYEPTGRPFRAVPMIKKVRVDLI
jgi:hypothetical protein